MSNETERWQRLDTASYDDVAEQFGVHSDRLSSGAARHLLQLAAAAPSERVLDVGTGAGLLAFELLRCGPRTGPVTGIDIAPGMIAAARRRAAAARITGEILCFEEMDAERLDFADASFDLVLSGFALTHVPHPDAALAETFRVLRPGGRLAIAVGSQPPLPSWDACIHALREVRYLIQKRTGRRLSSDLLDRIMIDRCGPAPHHLPRGSQLSRQVNRVRLLGDLVLRAGFVAPQRRWSNYQNEIATATEFWDIHRTIRSDARKRLIDAPSDTIDAIRGQFFAECEATQKNGGLLTFPISVAFVVARKPG